MELAAVAEVAAQEDFAFEAPEIGYQGEYAIEMSAVLGNQRVGERGRV